MNKLKFSLSSLHSFARKKLFQYMDIVVDMSCTWYEFSTVTELLHFIFFLFYLFLPCLLSDSKTWLCKTSWTHSLSPSLSFSDKENEKLIFQFGPWDNIHNELVQWCRFPFELWMPNAKRWVSIDSEIYTYIAIFLCLRRNEECNGNE